MSIASKLAEERRRRLAAERLLELKQAELFAANRKLGEHARQLSHEIVETRAEVATVRNENKRVKSDLSAAHQEIKRVERRLIQSLESINDGFAFYSPELELVLANPAYLSVFDGLEDVKPGISYVTLLQLMTDEGIVNTGNDTPAEWRHKMIERVQSPNPEAAVIQLWNGQHIRMLDRRGPDGDVISLGINITATVRYEEKLKAARESAEAANRAKSAFLANMSHEIRTPMNGVVGMADVLLDTDLTEEQLLYVDTIKNSGDALLVIINDVLDYSKIEAERLQLHPEPFDLEKSIHEVLMLLQSSAKDKGIVLALNYALDLTNRFVGDPGRIRQILTNLIGNAVKFTTDGSVTVHVDGKPLEDGKTVALSVTVEDTGIGIPQDMIDHVFGEFNQVESERNRQFDGTGLGLAITKQLVAMMGGRIWLTSEEGVGSRFGFDLEMQAPDGPQVARPELDPGMRHVLVIDPSPVSGTQLTHQLEKLGLKVTQCVDADSAFSHLDDSIDLILVEHIMTGESGLEFARKARASGHTQSLMLLSNNPGNARNDQDKAAIDHIIQRPFLRNEFFACLATVRPTGTEETDKVTDQPVAHDNTPTFSHRATGRTATASGGWADPDATVPAVQPVEDIQSIPRLMRVLAAEDNKTNRLVFGKMLKSLNIDLQFACDGQAALEMYQTFAPDIVFMDISMPRMDGKQATREIRKLEESKGQHIPIVAMTAHAMSGDDNEILQAGLDVYLTKPLKKAEITAQIVEHCPVEAEPPVIDMPDQAVG